MARFSNRVVKQTFIADRRMTLRLILAIQGDGSVGVVNRLRDGPSRDRVSISGSRDISLQNFQAGHVARMGEERGAIGSWWENRREKDHWGDLGVDGWIILGRISRRWDAGIWTGLGWPRIETGGGRL